MKYVSATAAVVGASALGLNQVFKLRNPSATSNQNISITQSTTASSSAISTLATTKTTDLPIQLFHDLHGDGQQEADEPSITDLALDIHGVENDFATTVRSESDGKYWARNIPIGKRYQIIPNTDRFRYVALSNAEFRRIGGYNYLVDSDEPTLHLGLMEGFLTSPIPPSLRESIWYYVDLDPSTGLMDWMGGTQTYDGHQGVDFFLPEASPTVAAAPGVVYDIQTINYNQCGPTKEPCTATQIIIQNTTLNQSGDGDFSIHDHMVKVDVKKGQFVKRGQQIGLAGQSGMRSHLHFAYFLSFDRHIRDPFRFLLYPQHSDWPFANNRSMWTEDNRLHYAEP